MDYNIKLDVPYQDDKGDRVLVIKVNRDVRPQEVVFHPTGEPKNKETMKLYEFKQVYSLVPRRPAGVRAKPVGYRLYPKEIEMLAELGEIHGSVNAALRECIRSAYSRQFP